MRSEFEKRLFIGIPAGREIRPILFDIQSSLEYNPGKIRWVPPENIHMTLFFLGSVPIDDIPSLTTALENAANFNHFRSSIEKTGVFPSVRHPKILWLGINLGRQKMFALNKKVEKVATLFKESRKKEYFSPHITIGRTTRSCGEIDFLSFLKYVYSPRELDVNYVVLYESILLPHGADYKVITKLPLN